ncbi:MAG: hypothetical protein IJP10_01840 [Clostridia bacterium]|nr:hypothetical protein [Clostridia bacterium]
MNNDYNPNPTPNPNPTTDVKKSAFSGGKIALLVILAVLLLSPWDLLPDIVPLLPVDNIDDIGYAVGIGKMIYDMVKQKKAEKAASQNQNQHWDV